MPMMVFSMGVVFGTERYAHLYALNIFVVTAGVVIASYGETRGGRAGCRDVALACQGEIRGAA